MLLIKKKKSINSSSFLSILIMVMTICLVKFLAFPFIFPYILYMFPTKEGMLHGSHQAENSTKVGKDPYSDPDPDQEPNKDIHMGNDDDSDDSDNSDYPDIVSTKWSAEYFKGYERLYLIPFDVWGTYFKPHVDQVLLGNSVKDIFANSKTTIEISKLKNRTDLEYDCIEKPEKMTMRSMF